MLREYTRAVRVRGRAGGRDAVAGTLATCLAIAIGALALAGCGVRGPLKLPQAAAATTAPAASPPAPAASPSEAPATEDRGPSPAKAPEPPA